MGSSPMSLCSVPLTCYACTARVCVCVCVCLREHRDELLRYGNHALTRRMVDRIFTQEPRRFQCTTLNRMGYEDFVRKCIRCRLWRWQPCSTIWSVLCGVRSQWTYCVAMAVRIRRARCLGADFCLSEEDKTTDTSIEFWFRCCNLDNDGVLTLFEMEHFYREQLYRMHCLNVEAVPIADLLCQLYVFKHTAPCLLQPRYMAPQTDRHIFCWVESTLGAQLQCMLEWSTYDLLLILRCD